MGRTFSGLFNQPHVHLDGLTQPQREALVDLLHFCISADESLTLVEDKFVTAEAAHLDWKAGMPFEDFALQSLTRGQTAVKSPESRSTYLQDIARRLGATDLQTRAVALCQHAFAADGRIAEVERAVFGEIKVAFGWPGSASNGRKL